MPPLHTVPPTLPLNAPLPLAMPIFFSGWLLIFVLPIVTPLPPVHLCLHLLLHHCLSLRPPHPHVMLLPPPHTAPLPLVHRNLCLFDCWHLCLTFSSATTSCLLVPLPLILQRHRLLLAGVAASCCTTNPCRAPCLYPPGKVDCYFDDHKCLLFLWSSHLLLSCSLHNCPALVQLSSIAPPKNQLQWMRSQQQISTYSTPCG
jgi:hypothetical protein